MDKDRLVRKNTEETANRASLWGRGVGEEGRRQCRWVCWEGQRALSSDFMSLCLRSLACEGLWVGSAPQGPLVTHRSSARLNIVIVTGSGSQMAWDHSDFLSNHVSQWTLWSLKPERLCHHCLVPACCLSSLSLCYGSGSRLPIACLDPYMRPQLFPVPSSFCQANLYSVARRIFQKHNLTMPPPCLNLQWLPSTRRSCVAWPCPPIQHQSNPFPSQTFALATPNCSSALF